MRKFALVKNVVQSFKVLPKCKTSPQPTLGEGVQSPEKVRVINSCVSTVKHLFSYSPINLFTSKKCAFTLAEVLITLGIIGVVAAMTMPTLIAKHQKMVLKNQFKKAYANIENAIRLTTAEYGTTYDCYASYYQGFAYHNTECRQFWDNLFSHMNVIKSCAYRTEGCGVVYKKTAEVISEGGSVTNSSCIFLDSSSGNEINIMNDGSYIITSRTGSNGHHNIYFALDINGEKGPNKWGYDLFYVMLYRNTLSSNVISLDQVCAIKEKDGYYFKEMLTK